MCVCVCVCVYVYYLHDFHRGCKIGIVVNRDFEIDIDGNGGFVHVRYGVRVVVILWPIRWQKVLSVCCHRLKTCKSVNYITFSYRP